MSDATTITKNHLDQLIFEDCFIRGSQKGSVNSSFKEFWRQTEGKTLDQIKATQVTARLLNKKTNPWFDQQVEHLTTILNRKTICQHHQHNQTG